jgi:hypothetical protein
VYQSYDTLILFVKLSSRAGYPPDSKPG